MATPFGLQGYASNPVPDATCKYTPIYYTSDWTQIKNFFCAFSVRLLQFQAETVKHYEKELERKQNTITKLTQANREYEKVFIDSIKAPSNDTIQLRNENEQLKAEISKLKEKIADLQKQNDEMRYF